VGIMSQSGEGAFAGRVDGAAPAMTWPVPYLASLAAVAAVGLGAGALAPVVGNEGFTTLMLLPVLWSAVRYGRAPAMVTAAVAAVAGNYFLFQPAFAFGFARLEDAVVMAVFLITALVTSGWVERARAAAQERARLAEEMAEARALEALLSSVSHDFRTPLGTIIGSATTLLSEDAQLDEKARRGLLGGILQAAQRLHRYTRNLIDITSIESGALRLRRDWTDLGDVLGTALDGIERPVAVRLEDDLPLLWVDTVLVERVLVNLLENAVKHAPAGAAIEVSARRAGGGMEVEVFNAGSDLPDDQLEAVFGKFRRGPAAGAEGSGLGLSIVRGFMAAHGGTVAARRDPARGGLAFRLWFPAADAAPAAAMEMDDD